jgi:hypothetical protein
MRRRLVLAALAMLPLLLAPGSRADAQWLKYPSPGVPRTASGAPNLEAPAPRAPDGRPDLSGIWVPLDNRPCPAEGCADMKVGQQFVDMGWGIPGGLPYQPWAAALTRQRTAELRLNDPNSQCLPTGIVRMHTTPLYRKVVQTPGAVIILNERQVWYRQIFTDGRPLPSDPLPTWNGYSVGKWDGDTLVVESNGFRDGMWLDANGSPLTEAGKITERFHRANFGTLDITVTVDDPKAYTKPWTTTIRHLIALDTELVDYVCQENEKDTKHLVVGKP